MIDIKAALTRKVGPLPVFAWIGVAAGGIIIGRKVLGKGGGTATSILGSGGDASGSETGFGESALPVDVTGRAPVDVAPTPIIPGYSELPIGEGAGFWDEFPIFDTGGAAATVTPPPTAAPGIAAASPCSKVHLTPGLGRYPGAPNRECPQGYHLNRVPLTPCFGYCVPN